MDDITSRMRRLTDELAEIQQQLQQALLEGPIGPETIGAADQPIFLESVRDFKAVVDQMRHFLWFFLQAVSDSDSGEKLVELLREAARATDSRVPTLEQMDSLNEYAILHYPIPPNRKPN